MKKQHRRFRWAFAPFALAAAAALAAFAAGCGSGLLDTEDKDESFYATKRVAATATALFGNYGMKGEKRITFSVDHGNFTRAFIKRLSEATESNRVDITDYFTVTTGTSERLITRYKFEAVSSVSSSIPSVSGSVNRGGGSFSAVLTFYVGDEADGFMRAPRTGTLTITAAADVLGEDSPLVCNSDISYTFTESEHTLVAPTGSALMHAVTIMKDMKELPTGLNTAALITTSYPIAKPISPGIKIGDATVGGRKGITVYAAKAVDEAEGKIFVLLNDAGAISYDYSGRVEIELAEDLIPNSEDSKAGGSGKGRIFSADDASKVLYQPYLGLDFDEETDASAVSKGPSVSPYLVDDGAGGWALCEDATSASGYRGGFTIKRDSTPSADAPKWGISYDDGLSYTVEFDLKFDGLAYETSYSHFYLYNNAVDVRLQSNDYALSDPSKGQKEQLTGNPPNANMKDWVWHFSADSSWVKSGAMQHYKVVVNYDKTAGASTVTAYVDGTRVDTTTDIGGGDVQGVLLETARGTKMTIDNIIIYYAGADK